MNIVLGWLWEPYYGHELGFLKGIYKYFFDASYRICAKVKHIAYSTPLLSKYLSRRLLIRHGLVISPGVRIGRNLKLPHPIGIVIGCQTVLGDDCTIYQGVTIGQNRNGYPKIGNDVIIYSGAKIFGDITIGNHVVIGANSVVKNNIPDNSVVVGIPARVLRRIDNERDSALF